MDRPISYSQQQLRSFDFVAGSHDVLVALASIVQDLLGGTTTVVSGVSASQTSTPSLTINLASGRIYQLAQADATAVGAIPQDSTEIMQQGEYAGGTVALSTSGISAGQSRWSLIQAQFSQVDEVRANDPTGGVLFYYNAANPSQPYQGPNNNFASQPTERSGQLILQVINGAAATTGSEVPPTPTSGWVPLYLIDLTNGQTAVTNSEILVAAPSVGTNVPSNYPYAPFLAGLLNSHHDGEPGQAPKINLATETQGTLPSGSLPAGTSIPTGTLIDLATSSVPAGFLACNGAAISRTTYANLFSAIGTTWGVGDGSTTFNLPNAARAVTVGSGGTGTSVLGNSVGSTGGEEAHTLVVAEIPPLSVTLNFNAEPQSGSTSNCLTGPGSSVSVTGTTNGGSGAHNNIQPSIVVLRAIKY